MVNRISAVSSKETPKRHQLDQENAVMKMDLCNKFANVRQCCLCAISHKVPRSFIIVLGFLIYCEVIHYAVVLLQCTWPSASSSGAVKGQLKAMFIADTHLLGFKNGHWFDKFRREWQMKQAFQTTMLIHKPDVVFVLGDLLDEGKWCQDEEFEYHVSRFKSMFAVPYDTELHVLSGNHDEGFHYVMTDHKHLRFEKKFNSPSVRLVQIQNIAFVMVNSMAMEGDGCSICAAAENQLQAVAKHLNKLQRCDAQSTSDAACKDLGEASYTQPILLQHFPMYRLSDADCDTEDSALPQEKLIPFRPRYDCLDERSTNLLMASLQPRLVISAHTHNGCYRVHPNGVPEWSVASFSWRNRNNPTFLLARINNHNFTINQCFMPEERTVVILYVLAGLLVCISLLWPSVGLRYRKKIC